MEKQYGLSSLVRIQEVGIGLCLNGLVSEVLASVGVEHPVSSGCNGSVSEEVLFANKKGMGFVQ